MNKAISFLKSALNRVLVVFLAGVLLVFSTACSGPASAGVAGTDRPGVSGEGSQHGPIQQHELYDPIQDRQGGMNEYSDVDPRFSMDQTNEKARELIDTTERNMIDMTDDVGTNTRRTWDKKVENAEQEDFGDNAREGVQNLRQQARESANTVTNAADRARQDFTKNSRQAAEKTSDYVQDRTSAAANRTQRALDKAQDAID